MKRRNMTFLRLWGKPKPFRSSRRPTSTALSAGSSGTIDQRGIPTHECFNCGSRIFTIHASFEDYSIAMWLLEGTCARCGSPVTVPCPVDDPEREIE